MYSSEPFFWLIISHIIISKNDATILDITKYTYIHYLKFNKQNISNFLKNYKIIINS